MVAGTFAQKIRKLNPNLRIAAGDRSRPAGLYFMKNGEEETVCGVDYNDVPERMVVDVEGHIIKAGWQRTLRILINRNLITKRAAKREFPLQDRRLPPIVVGAKHESTIEAIQKLFLERFDPDVDAPRIKKDEIMDFANSIRRK